MSEERVAALPLDERARLEFATRQFERARGDQRGAARLAGLHAPAISTWTARSTNTSSSACACAGTSSARPARSSASPRAPTSAARLRARVRRWVASLREIAARKRAATPLAEAQALLAVAQDRTRFPDERDALVYDLAASGELHRFADATPPGPEAALAYFRLGEIESRVGRSFWLSQTEVYFETAIRMAPGEPFAPQALAQLQEFLVSGYTGSGGRQVPADVQIRLAELRGLVERARPAAPGCPRPRASSRASGGPMTLRAGARAGGGRGRRAADRLRDLPYPV